MTTEPAPPSRARTRSRLGSFDGALGSLVVAASLCVAFLPLVATAPLSAAGAELVSTSFGGVLRPPGSPLQAWLNRAFIELPIPPLATRLALISLLGHVVAVFFLAEGLRALRAGLAVRIAGASLFAFFPTTWLLGVQADVYALAYALCAALLWHPLALAGVPPPRRRARDAALFGAVVGLALSQHVLVLVAAPAMAASVALLLEERRGRGLRLAVALGAALVVVVPLYASLPLLRGVDPWPDWGALEGAADVARHALLLDAAPATGAGPRGIALLLDEVVGAFLPAAALAAFGVLALARAHRRLELVVSAAPLVLALVLSTTTRAEQGELAAASLLHLHGFVVLPASLLAGVGLQALASRVDGGRGRALALVLGAAVVVVVVVGALPRVDVARRNELVLFRVALGAQLPPDAVWISSDDVEVFQGALALKPGVEGWGGLVDRFPVSLALLDEPWYRDDVLPRLEPRIAWGALPARATSKDVVDAALARGLLVASTERIHLEAPGRTPRLGGMVWVQGHDELHELTWRTVEGAAVFCTLIADLTPMRPEAPPAGRRVWRLFARTYAAAAQYLARVDEEGAALADAVARALARGDDPEAWIAPCTTLRARVAAMRDDHQSTHAVDPNRLAP